MTALFEKETQGGGVGEVNSIRYSDGSIIQYSRVTRDFFFFLRILENKFYVSEKNPICMMRE